MSHSNINNATSSPNTTHHSLNTNSFNCTHSVYNHIAWQGDVNNLAATDEGSEILAWLSPIGSRSRHQHIRTRRVDNVGQWLLETEKFQRWCDVAEQDGSDYAALFCCGDPAVGKTYFSSLVVDRLCDRAREQDIAVACFYFDYAAREEQSPTSVLGSILKQIVAGLERIPEGISRNLQAHKKVIGGRGLRVSEIVEMLQTVASLRPTFICIDALDESVDGHRAEVLDSLKQVLDKSPNTRVFLTGRRHIKGEIERHLPGRAATLYVKPNSDDIVEYIRKRLSIDTCPDAMDSVLEAEIISSIAENIPETFLLISLTMDAILREATVHGRRQRLKAVTDGLSLKDVYGATLERIREQGGDKTRLGMAALMWISYSERLLQPDELFHALAVEIGSTDLNPQRIPSAETLLSCCLGLVVVDSEASTVRLVHFTLQEYLYTFPDLFGEAHSAMAQTCLTYLNFPTIKEISPTRFTPPHSTIFLKYSSLYWGVHARRGATRDVVSLAFKLFSQIQSHISTRLLLADVVSKTGRYTGDIPNNAPLIGFTGLHCASVFGIVEIATALIGRPNCDLNQRDFLGITPLIWTAICGQEEVAKALIEQEAVSLDKPDNCFRRTALAWAAGKGHEGIVRLFLCRASAKPDGTDRWWGKTSRVMNMALRRRYVDPNRPDKYGQTPISLAAEEGHEGAMEVLLGRKDVKPDVVDGYGRTPLFWASVGGREGAVGLLLARGNVDLDRPDKNGETLLLSAAESGYEGVVGLLLERKDINPNKRGTAGQTPLSLASQKGHDGVVKLLLGREDVNPNLPDRGNRAPLSLAAMNGHDEVVGLLLGREDTKPDILGNGGHTPLSFAAINGHDGVVKLLLGRGDVNPNMVDNGGQTPISLASENGHDGVVMLLLGRKDINPDMPDHGGRSPLSLASEEGHDGVVKILLGREDVYPDMPEVWRGRTPLSFASEKGHYGVVKLLLGREDVNTNAPEAWHGRTPLSFAAMNGHDGAVKLLLGRKDINSDALDHGGRTPFSLATTNGHGGVVKLLLGQEDVNPNMPDHCGRTPLLFAAMNGHEGAVEILLGRKDINPHEPSKDGLTPLSLASEKGHAGVVKLLQACQSENTNT